MIDIVTRLIECAKRAMPNDSGKEHGLAGLCLEAAREIENARREAASWEQQASDRTDDAVRFAQERDALKAKVEAMEKQEPAMWANSSNIVSARISRERGTVGDQHSCSETKTAYHDAPLYALPGAQQCKNCNGMGDRFDPSGEKIPCDLCESNLEEIRALVAEAAHDIISGSDFWLSTSLAAKKIYALPGAQAQSAPSVLVDLTPLESVQYWADAYGNPMGDEHFLGHGVAARLLREYVNLRAMLAAAPEIKP